MRKLGATGFDRLAPGGRYGFKVIRNILPWKVVFGVLLISFLGSPARANLITNGSFETPMVPAGGFTNFLSGSTSITGWTVTGPEVSIVSADYVSLGFSFTTNYGSQWLDLTGDGSNAPADGVEQAVATVPGATYNLSYFVGNVGDPGGIYGTTSTVYVSVDGMSSPGSTNSLGAGGTAGQVWEQFSTSFVATSTSTTIGFFNGDPSNDNTNGLDNVVVTQGTSTAATPEPSTLAMFVLGICVFGFLGLRSAGILPASAAGTAALPDWRQG